MSIVEMKVANIAEHPTLQSAHNTEFINNYYALSQEPMNLREVGQKWFNAIYCRECRKHSVGLVLGGTPWLGTLLKRKGRRAIMVDINAAMLETAEREIERDCRPDVGHVEYVCANWLELPEFSYPIDVILGDNCLNFLQYPDGWAHFFDALVPKLSEKAELLIRFIAIPPTHQAMSVDQIVRKYMQFPSLNYTEVRAQLLLAHWEPGPMSIRTETVVDVFEDNRTKFDPLFAKFPAAQNDLVTIRKFKNSGFVLVSPPLQEIVRFLSEYFTVSSIHFGPFGLSEYFPIVFAKRR